MRTGPLAHGASALVTVYVRAGCAACDRARRALDEAGLGYLLRDVGRDPRIAAEARWHSGLAGVPQTFLGDLHVPGAADLVALEGRGLLGPLARGARAPLERVGAAELARGARRLGLAEALPEREGGVGSAPEARALLDLRARARGPRPSPFGRLSPWPEACERFVRDCAPGAIGHACELGAVPTALAAALDFLDALDALIGAPRGASGASSEATPDAAPPPTAAPTATTTEGSPGAPDATPCRTAERLRAELGLVPAWLGTWPERSRARAGQLYLELMRRGPSPPVPSELRHLMARVAAIAADEGYLAAFEGWQAHRAGGAGELGVERVHRAWDAATGRALEPALFAPREVAALRLAWLSAHRPPALPARLVRPALEAWGPVELVQLAFVCALGALARRVAARARPAIEPAVRAFADAHGLATDPLRARYPEIDEL